VIDDLASLRLPSQEYVDWFRSALSAAFADMGEYERRQAAALRKRRSELAGMQARLLNAYLAGTVDEAISGPRPPSWGPKRGPSRRPSNASATAIRAARPRRSRASTSASRPRSALAVQTTPFGARYWIPFI
jgi:hypothetical protein